MRSSKDELKIREYKVHIYRERSPQINVRAKNLPALGYRLYITNGSGYVREDSQHEHISDLAGTLAQLLTAGDIENELRKYDVSFEARKGAGRELNDDEYEHFQRHFEHKLQQKEHHWTVNMPHIIPKKTEKDHHARYKNVHIKTNGHNGHKGNPNGQEKKHPHRSYHRFSHAK